MVGSSNVDLISRVPRVPGPGETIFGSRFYMGFGGKGANQAVMAARLGAQVSVVTKVGKDVFGQDTLRNFREQGCDTTHVLFDEERFSGVAPIMVDDATGQNSIVVVAGANDGLSPRDVQAAADSIISADVVICQLEIPIESTLEAFRVARRNPHVLTILNPAPAAQLPDEVYRLTDILIPNESEARLLTGMEVDTVEQAAAAARALHSRGPKTVIVTLGARGALLLEDSSEPQVIAAEIVKAVDTTGAGDAFVGSLAYMLGAGVPMADAVRRACAIATLSVLKPGTQTSFPKREEVLHLLPG
jgi:ribokinase